MNGRFGSEQRLDSRQAHDERFDQDDVVERLQGFHQDAKDLLDILVGDALADAAVDDERARLQSRVVAEREAPRQRRPRAQPITIWNVSHAGLHNLKQRVGDDFERGQRQSLAIRRQGLRYALVSEPLLRRVAAARAKGGDRGRLDLADAEQDVEFRQRELIESQPEDALSVLCGNRTFSNELFKSFA